jgi:hypothetical protein
MANLLTQSSYDTLLPLSMAWNSLRNSADNSNRNSIFPSENDQIRSTFIYNHGPITFFFFFRRQIATLEAHFPLKGVIELKFPV